MKTSHPAKIGAQIKKEIKKHKVLLLQDAAYPSIVSLVTGESIRGSWWSHPMANPIYNGLLWLERDIPQLVVKLLSGKVTYLDPSLWSDFFAIVGSKKSWQTKGLQDHELELLQLLGRKSYIASDDQKLKASIPNFKKAIEKLEKRLLVDTSEEHSPSGKHVKVIRRWQKSPLYVRSGNDASAAMKKIDDIVDQNCNLHGARVKLPWPRN